ncbi:MAG: SGNH/GDSL hydrolase family protein [Acidobacteria bacterium]|nr:SGNH/GDSL hydrolase family protein [Acidobacteriota bacterium]
MHLALPLAILADRLVARVNGFHHALNSAAIAGAGLWLAAGAGFWVWARTRPEVMRRVTTPLLTLYTLLVCLIVGELGLWVVFGGSVFSRQKYVYPPGSRHLAEPDAKEMPGVSGKSAFSVNEAGLRGPPMPREGVYRIVTIGGSTTECLSLDDSEEWPGLVMRYVNAASPARRVWVGNAGVAGYTAVHHLRFARELASIRQADLWIFLPGVNDLALALAAGGAPTDVNLERAAEQVIHARFVQGHLFTHFAWLDRLLVWQLGRLAAGRPPGPLLRHDFRGFHGQLRKGRARARRAALPSLEAANAEYAGRIAKLCAECRQSGKRCLFLTQPTIWRSDLPPEAEALLWFGYTRDAGGVGYLSPGDLAQAMAGYNEALLRVSRQNGMESLDLAASIPKDTSAFFDDCHFNENGARMVALAIAQYLAGKPQ